MPLYTPGRRRAIILLLLTSVLLLTLDLRGNAVFDAARTGFNKVLDPIETAADVITRPIENAWNGITNYDDLERRNQELNDRVDAQAGAEAAGRAAVLENEQLRQLLGLSSLGDFDTVTANVVGQSPTNQDQIIEIDKGSDDGLRVGMAAMNEAGLVGKVTTPLEPHRARIMLITDRMYTVQVKIVPATPETTTTTSTTTTTTTIAGQPAATTTSTSSTTTTTSSTTTTTTSPRTTTTTTAPGPTTTLPPTTTTIDTDIVRETGGLSGRGDGQLPQVQFLADVPTLGRYRVGDYVFTSGARDSPAPANIGVGRVVNVIGGSTAAGPRLEVEPLADLDRLNFVTVVLYQPEIEAPTESGD
jgi:rod shape-determining protein MreC